jgi:hypothetical protein
LGQPIDFATVSRLWSFSAVPQFINWHDSLLPTTLNHSSNEVDVGFNPIFQLPVSDDSAKHY